MACPKSILITGAGRGLGLELVKQILSLSGQPKYVFAACRDPSKAETLQRLAKENPCLKIIPLDVTEDSTIQAAYEQTASVVGEEGLNLLINNAGVNDKANNGSLEVISRDKMQSHFNINATAPVIVAQKFLPLLKKAAKENQALPVSCQRAAIINISTIMSSIQNSLSRGICNAYHYRMSKAALNMATALMSSELKESGVLVTAVHPGWVKTDMGGPSADLDAETSIKHVWSLVTTLTSESSGKLYNYDGSFLPW